MPSITRSKLNRFLRNLVLSGGVLVVAVVTYGWLIKPHLEYISSMNQNKKAIRKLEQSHTDLTENVAALKKELAKLQQDFENIDAALFDPVKANEFFSDLQVLSEAQNCLQNSLTFMHTTSPPRADMSAAQGTYIIPRRATWNIVGTYKDLAALMNTLQNNAKQVWIDSLSIRPISNSDMLNCEATITLYVIHNKEKRFDE